MCGSFADRQSVSDVFILPFLLSGVSQVSGKAMARTGLRMMPTFPSPPLKFRTAGFPQYGFKAGLSEGAFPREAPNCRAHPVCFPPSRSSLSTCMSRSVSGQLGAWALPFE